MANNKILARDCLVWLKTIPQPNWMYSTFVEPVSADTSGVYLTRSMSIETTLETVDVTGVVAQIAANVDNRRETRITLSRMVPMVDFSSGVILNAAARKFVPKDIPITLTFYNNTSSYRSIINVDAKADLVFATFARSVEMTLRVENVRVDGTGDLYVVKRPSLVDGRCRVEGLMLYPSASADLDYLFFNHDQSTAPYPRIIVQVTINLPVSGTQGWVYQFLGGISRYSVDVDNPMRQSLELVSIGAGGTSSAYGTPAPTFDPVASLFSVSGGLYQNLAFAAAVKIPNATPSRTIKGNYGVEELTLSISENEVVYNLTGVSFDEKGFVLE